MVIDVSNEGMIRHTVDTINKTAFEEDEKVKLMIKLYPQTCDYIVEEHLKRNPEVSWDEIKRFLSEFYNVTIGDGQFKMADKMFLKMIKKGFK